MAWMYILECADGSYYVGSTKNLEQRLFQHQEGIGAKYTSRRLPVKLVYSEEYGRVSEAFAREKQFKIGAGQNERRSLIANTNPCLL